MNIWACIPSRLPRDEAQRAIDAWGDKGYLTAVWRDRGAEPLDCDINCQGEYRGYAHAINFLTHRIRVTDGQALWMVAADERTAPDAGNPTVTAHECTLHFRGTFGVVLPTGARVGNDTVTGLWLGHEFCERMNGGAGPFYARYAHAEIAGEELIKVANSLGVLRQRRDLLQLRKDGLAGNWTNDIKIFRERERAGFPGHAPVTLAAGVFA